MTAEGRASIILRVKFFGEPEIFASDGRRFEEVTRKQKYLLAFLWLNRKQPQSRERIVGHLWPETHEEKARHSLSQALHHLKRSLEKGATGSGSFLLTSRTTIHFKIDAPCIIDASRFESLMERSEPLDAEASIEAIKEAVELYHGDFLESCYDDWCQETQLHFKGLYGDALTQLMKFHVQRNELDEAIRYARKLLVSSPWLEEIHRELMRLFSRKGDKAAALRQFQECERILKRELDAAPSPETIALLEEIRSTEADPVTRQVDLEVQRLDKESRVVGDERRLAAVLVADIVGYSAIMEKDEQLALKFLEILESLLNPLWLKHRGQKIKSMGDSYLLEFYSALDSVQCALEIQKVLLERNQSVVSDEALIVRIGIHLGELVHREGDVFGDGVNIATRIQPLAESGGICISQQIFDQVKRRVEIPLASLGKQGLKNIEEPLEVYRMVLPWLASSQPLPSKRSARSGEKRIAALPFSNISPDPRDEYFSDGITEELISSLTKIKGLQVAARTSAFAFKGKSLDVREIGEKLDVEYVLEGSVRRFGEHLRISAQLSDAIHGYHLWSDQYNRFFKDIFEVQQEISNTIVEQLRMELAEDPASSLAVVQSPTEDLEAYHLYLKGRYFWDKRTPAALETSIQYFQRAISKDPNYARAYAGLADSYNVQGYYHFLSPIETFPLAKSAAKRAIELDDHHAEAHTSLALAHDYSWEWSDAEKHYQRAIELNPGYATTHHWYALYLMEIGRLAAAFEEMQQAHLLDPLSLMINRDLGMLFYYSRDYHKAAEQLTSTIEMDASFVNSQLFLGLTYLMQGECEKSIKALLKEEKIGGTRKMDHYVEALRGVISARMGKTDQARQVLRKLRGRTPASSLYHQAILAFELSEVDVGFELLQSAFDQHEFWLGRVLVDPFLDPVRKDERFQQLLQKMQLNDVSSKF